MLEPTRLKGMLGPRLQTRLFHFTAVANEPGCSLGNVVSLLLSPKSSSIEILQVFQSSEIKLVHKESCELADGNMCHELVVPISFILLCNHQEKWCLLR